jgi:hypothetical protein
MVLMDAQVVLVNQVCKVTLAIFKKAMLTPAPTVTFKTDVICQPWPDGRVTAMPALLVTDK